jgi:hypothetical protein
VHYLHCLYDLQRVIEEPGISEFQLRRETGLENYEISRGCKFLAVSGLISQLAKSHLVSRATIHRVLKEHASTTLEKSA